MPDLALTARSPLAGAQAESWPGFALAEVTDLALASFATRREQEAALRIRAEARFGFEPPPSGRTASSDGMTFLWTGHEQWFVEAPESARDSLEVLLRETFADTATVTDQSDAWANLRLEGPATRAVLEKLCPLDLHPGAFPAGTTARTTMEHVSAVITLRDDRGRFTILTPRSSAGSFLHHLRLAADSACGVR
ncbi:MAG: sarcosine oxidase subunit gamma family protein [Kiloniellales bacterium]|nr:sarcosine oxidase subunit gamma family protein [Kiloniellales bacterium]